MHTAFPSHRMNNPITISDETVKLIVDPKMGGSFLTFSTKLDDR